MICAIVLAAGCSSRMGTQKLLLPFGKQTVISHVVTQVLAGKIESVYVIVGHQDKEIINELSGKPITIIHNPEYQSGMLSSVRKGLASIPQNCEGVLVILGDQPSITSELIEQMIQSFTPTKKKIIVPVYNGKRGHPLLLPGIFRDEILTSFDDIGLRGILQVHSEDIFEMDVADPGVISDMDYPRDYQREIERYENRGDREN